MRHLELGASIYVPATRGDLQAVAVGTKLVHARSIIFCTEDSVSESELPKALRNVAEMLATCARTPGRLLFVRPRNAQVLTKILQIPGIDAIDGFALPKTTCANLPAYLRAFDIAGKEVRDFWLMPTLETKEVFDVEEMRNLREVLLQPGLRDYVLSLRIGGNDLLNLLGVRRSRYRTIYESPLGVTISQLVTMFKPNGFNLTSPVCEFLYDHEVLEREIAIDAEYGLFGKTAIHPDQIAVIEQSYRPSEQDVHMAQAILAPDAPAVFNMHGTMCEIATHHAWASQVLARANLYGVYGKTTPPMVADNSFADSL